MTDSDARGVWKSAKAGVTACRALSGRCARRLHPTKGSAKDRDGEKVKRDSRTRTENRIESKQISLATGSSGARTSWEAPRDDRKEDGG